MHGTSCFGIGAFCARYGVPEGLPLTSGEERFGEMGLNHREGSGDSVLQLKIEYRFCNLPEEGTFLFVQISCVRDFSLLPGVLVGVI